MSEIQKLKQTLEGIASTAKQTGGNLNGFKSKFSAQIGTVQSVLSGSSQRADKEVVQALQTASKQVEAAIGALEQAAKVAAAYGRSL